MLNSDNLTEELGIFKSSLLNLEYNLEHGCFDQTLSVLALKILIQLHSHTRTHKHTHLFWKGRKPWCRQVNIRSTWQQWCVMRCCSGNKVFVGTLEHSHITSLLILGDQLPVGMATGTWLKPEARPESKCPEREHTHKECSSGRKKFRSAHGDPRPQPRRWNRVDPKPSNFKENSDEMWAEIAHSKITFL